MPIADFYEKNQILIKITTAIIIVIFLILLLRLRKLLRVKQNDIHRKAENLKATIARLEDTVKKLSKKQSQAALSDTYTAGYITLDMPDKLKTLFSDVMKGFEEYARLKGYEVAFSVDSSVFGKVAFKFNFRNHEHETDSQSIRLDIQEYIEKVKSGGHFDDLPLVISRQEHNLLSTTLKNRINFLQHSYHLEKNTREYYEKFISQIMNSKQSFIPLPAIYIQTGGVSQPRHLVANNSANILQGEDQLFENNGNQSINLSVTISHSFNKRKDQITKLDEIIKTLRQEKEITPNIRDRLITNFDKVKEELADEEQPDGAKIAKWLTNTKKILENIVLAHHLTEAIRWIYDSLSFLK